MKRTSRKLSKEQKESLLKSPYVEKAGNSIVNYTDEFKRMAVDQYQKGKSPVEIFTEAQISATEEKNEKKVKETIDIIFAILSILSNYQNAVEISIG